MKKHRKLLAVILSIVMILTLVPLALFASAEDEYVPYINTDTNTVNKEDGNYTISSLTELKWLATTVNAGNPYANSNFKLTADIDLSGTTWTPIGSMAEKAFSGTFDGDGHVITGLKFGTLGTEDTDEVRNNSQAAGLFGYVDGGTIQNLAVKDSVFCMTGLLSQVGPIVASLDEGTVTKCAVSDVTIDIEYTNAEVFTLNAIGGLVGASTGGTVSESYSTARVSVTAPVSIGNYVGGLVGRNNGTISNSYYAGNVALGESLIGYVGGLVGNNAGTIENSYSVGLVGGKLTAGVAGLNTGTITNCHYFETSASAGTYTTEDNKTYTPVVTSEDSISTFNNNTYTIVSSFASILNGGLLGNLTDGAFTGLEDAGQDLTGTNQYPFPVLKNNVFSSDMETPDENTTEFAGGNGTIYNPYQISTPAHLNNVRNHLSDAFILSDNVTFADYMYLSKDANIAALTGENSSTKLSDDDLADITAIVNGTTETETTTTTTAATSSTSNTETSSTSETTTQSGSGEGGTTPTVENVDLATLDISTLTDDQITEIEKIIGDIDVLKDGAFVNGFTPIGTIATPFVGNFNGNGKTINNIQIASTGTYAALFVRNLGIIDDLSIDHTTKSGSTLTYAEIATKPSSVTLKTAGTSGAYAAAVVVVNSGTVTDAEVNVDVTATSDEFKAYVAGLVAQNTGTVESSANSGVILAKFSDTAYTQAYKDIAANADIKVAGAVAINKSGAVVDGCYSNDSARSELTSASTTDGIVESNYIADDQATGTAAAAGKSNPTDEYLTYTVPAAYTRPANKYTTESGLTSAQLVDGASLQPSGTLTGAATYTDSSAADDNYQLVTIKYNDAAYQTSFLAWVELDVTKMTADTAKADKEFLKGQAFSSDGIKVTAKNADDEDITLSEVDNDADNGYVVKVYSREANTSTEEGAAPYIYTEIEDLSVQPAGTYYVKITYGGQEIPNSEYSIRVCDIKSIEITADYTTYMVDQAPVLDVTAIYDDTAETKKILDEYDVYLAESDEAFKATGFAGTPTDKFTAEGTFYVGVIDGKVKSNTVAVKVLAKDVKVTNLAVTTSADQTTETTDKVKADSIKLTWTDSDAPQYRVYRSTDGGTTWIKKASPKTDYYTDGTSVSGEAYKYKVVMIIAGEESEGAVEVSVTAPVPEKTSANITKANRYVGLYNEFKSGSVKVTGTYKNGTTETIGSAADAEKAKKSKYYFDTSDLNSAVPGEYEIGIMFNGAKVDEIIDNGTVVSAYKVKVIPPTAITAAADYTYYPIGYAEDAFKDTLTVKASYPEGTISGTTTVDSANFTTSYVANEVTEAGEKTIAVNYASFADEDGDGTYTEKQLTADVKVNFVPNVAPATVDAEAGATGINTVTFSDVTGAVSYNVYRASTSDSIYELIGEVTDVADKTTYTYDDEDAAPNAEYTYKVAAVIADQETPHSAATTAVVTVAPRYIKATFGDKFVTEYAVGQSLKTTEITVKAYYSKADYTPGDDFDTVESNENYTARDLTKSKKSGSFNYYYTSDYDKATAGTYTVKITYAGATEYNGEVIGSKTVTVYPIYKLEAETEETKYALGYEFTNDDLKVTATYGDETAKPEFKVSTLSSDDFVMLDEPDMSVAGSQTVTVALATNTDVKTTVDVLVYDPDKLIEVKDDSAYVDDTENNYITNIQPNTTVATLKTNLENDATTIQVVDKDGNALTRENLATGDKVQLVAGDTVLDERVIVVLGDTTGEGTIDVRDVKKTVNASLGKEGALTGAYLEAANVNGDTKVNVQDVKKILNVSIGKNETF